MFILLKNKTKPKQLRLFRYTFFPYDGHLSFAQQTPPPTPAEVFKSKVSLSYCTSTESTQHRVRLDMKSNGC